MIADTPYIDGKFIRPDAIVIMTADPFNGQKDVTCRMPYDAIKAARGLYSRTAEKLRGFSQQATGPRSPTLRVRYEYT